MKNDLGALRHKDLLRIRVIGKIGLEEMKLRTWQWRQVRPHSAAHVVHADNIISLLKESLSKPTTDEPSASRYHYTH